MCPKHPGHLKQASGRPVDLTGLPQLQPQRDAWPLLVHKLRRPASIDSDRSARRWAPAALAAVLLLALGVITLLSQRVDQQQQSLQAWIDYSQELESELRLLQGRNGAIRGHQAMAIGQLEERLAMLDWRLAQAPGDPQQQLPLWQRRTALLNDLVTVRAGQRFLPAEQQQRPVITLNRPTTLVAYEL